MTLIQESIRAVARFRLGPTRLGNVLARWAQQNYSEDFSRRGHLDVLAEHFDRGLWMRVNPTHLIGGAIYWRGTYAYRILQCVGQHLRSDMVLVDVGANQGEVTLYAARRLKRGKVIAFEPTRENFERLVSNVQLNGLGNVVALNHCLGEETGEVELFTAEQRSSHHRLGWNEGMPSMYASSDVAVPVAQVAVLRLDDVFPTLDVTRLDVLKIDVEGAELAVLRGALETIQRYRPLILTEINIDTYRAAGIEPIDVCSFLRSLKYEGHLLDRSGNRAALARADVPDHCDVVWTQC